MDNHQFIIVQGSTPTLELVFAFEVDVDDIVFATFSQNDSNVLEYSMNGTVSPAYIAGTGTLEIATGDSSVMLLAMSQADTLGLTPGDVELQVRVKTADGADTFLPLIGDVVRAHKTGVIS